MIDKTKEQRMVEAHNIGRAAALDMFTNIVEASQQYGDADDQNCFIAGMLGEIRRLAAIRATGVK